MATLKKVFRLDTIPIWNYYDYSDPNTVIIGHGKVGDIVNILERKFPGVKVELTNKTSGWVCQWNIE